ncbi:MAG: selenium cofactor biosynthesis protein YqeC [Clostridia bacterium]
MKEIKPMHIAKALNPERGVTAIIGGGGKTTLIEVLANELKKNGRVLITTSTHIKKPPFETLIDPFEADIIAAFKLNSILAIGRSEGEKLISSSLPFEKLAHLCDYVLVEADGSRGLPVKAPNDKEPVIPNNAKLVIAVIGLDAIGERIENAAHRPEIYADILGVKTNEIITPEFAARVLINERGQKKNINFKRFAAVLNKADDSERITRAYQVKSYIKDDAFIVSLINSPFVI